MKIEMQINLLKLKRSVALNLVFKCMLKFGRLEKSNFTRESNFAQTTKNPVTLMLRMMGIPCLSFVFQYFSHFQPVKTQFNKALYRHVKIPRQARFKCYSSLVRNANYCTVRNLNMHISQVEYKRASVTISKQTCVACTDPDSLEKTAEDLRRLYHQPFVC